MSINPNKTVHFHGVNQQDKTTKALDLHVEEIRRIGFTVLPEVLSREDVDYFRNSIDNCYQKQIEELGGEEIAERIGDAHNVRFPIALDERFLDIAAAPRIHEVFRSLLGENYVLMMQNAVINLPDRFQHQTYWHRDLNYQHWTSSQPLVANALFCIDDFTMENGCTVALPASHLCSTFPSEEFVLKHETPILANAGDVIMMDSMVYHRTGYNLSNQIRRAVNNVIGLPFITQQLDIPEILQGKYSEDDFLNRYLGYRWKPARNAKSWRLARMK